MLFLPTNVKHIDEFFKNKKAYKSKNSPLARRIQNKLAMKKVFLRKVCTKKTNIITV